MAFFKVHTTLCLLDKQNKVMKINPSKCKHCVIHLIDGQQLVMLIYIHFHMEGQYI